MHYWCPHCSYIASQSYSGFENNCPECGSPNQIQTPYRPEVLEAAREAMPVLRSALESRPEELRYAMLYLLQHEMLAPNGHPGHIKLGRSAGLDNSGPCSRCQKPVEDNPFHVEVRDRWYNTCQSAKICKECLEDGYYATELDYQRTNTELKLGLA